MSFAEYIDEEEDGSHFDLYEYLKSEMSKYVIDIREYDDERRTFFGSYLFKLFIRDAIKNNKIEQ